MALVQSGGAADAVAAAVATAKQCLAWDPNAALRAETQALLDGGDSDALVAAFGTRIAFGTAGESQQRCTVAWSWGGAGGCA